MTKTDIFIEKARKIHADKYDYSKVEYVGCDDKVCIICPEHGEFWQTPHNHLKGRGCPECCGKARLTTDIFVEKARKIHGEKYDYSKVEYINNESKVQIICPEHGEFEQTPHNHLKGRGCPECAKIAISNARKGMKKAQIPIKDKRSKTEIFIERAKKVHGDKYDYSKADYIGCDKKICIICPKHGEFWQNPHNHLYGKGCPKCAIERQVERNQKNGYEKFMSLAKKVHGDKYDYSKVNYMSNHMGVTITCPIHGDFIQRPYVHVQRNGGCPVCSIEGRSEKRKLPKEEFVERAKMVHGDKYEYIGDYVNYSTSIKILCPEHGEFYQTPGLHLKGCGCPKCGNVKIGQKLRLTKEDFIERAKNIHGDKYDYSKVEYEKNSTKVCIICPEHGEFWQTPALHLRGCGCPECRKTISETRHRLTQDEFEKRVTQIFGDKYDLSKSVYKSALEKVDIICKEHGMFSMRAAHLFNGHSCPECAKIYRSINSRKNFEDFKNEANIVHNNKYLYYDDNYINCHTKITITCPLHGEFKQTPLDHLQGKGCPKCGHLQSKAELEIIEFLKQYVKPEQIVERDREVLDGKEIDILLPDYHVGIEFNGLRWHSFKMKPERNYHGDKMVAANSKGYRLIQIFEDEWIERREIVLNKLRHVVGGDVDNPSVGARKCVVEPVNGQIAKDFLSTYHIQGYVPSSVYLGAYFKDELVGIMTFTEEKPKMWNLTRFATKTDYRLPGLANKMFKYFIKNYKFDEIKSFLDLRWNQCVGNNTVYDKLGFILTSILLPDYKYIVGQERKHKFGFRKTLLHKKYGLPLSMTEREMCDELGFERIYDCGLAKYVYKNPQTEK